MVCVIVCDDVGVEGLVDEWIVVCYIEDEIWGVESSIELVEMVFFVEFGGVFRVVFCECDLKIF